MRARRKGILSGIQLASAALLLMTSCAHPWFLVESTYQPVLFGLGDTDPQVVRTEEYEQSHQSDRTVALRAPDHCANLSSVQPTSGSSAASDVLRTDCGVEMAELERALVKADYRVISWNEIQARAKQEGGGTPIRAAKAIGVDVLLQINSLERSLIEVASKRTRIYFSSNRYGEKGEWVRVAEQRADALDTAMRVLEGPVARLRHAAVTIDLTAVSTDSGQSIWFYHRTVADVPEAGEDLGTGGISQLFECHQTNLSRCLLRTARPRPGTPRKPRKPTSTGSRAGIDELSGPAMGTGTHWRAAYYELVQRVMSDVVAEYARDS